MKNKDLLSASVQYLETLCTEIGERRVGSAGNRIATRFFEDRIAELGWNTFQQEFEAMDWAEGGAELSVGEVSFEVFPSPYSQGCEAEAAILAAGNIEELENLDMTGKIVLVHGDLAKEQLMPKNFVFYNPEEYQRIIAVLEKGAPAALVCATGRNSALAGGVYPFPLIEDGDFDIPSVYMTEEEGRRLLDTLQNQGGGATATLKSLAKRIPGTGCNVVALRGGETSGARSGQDRQKRVVVTAHIDAKKGTSGAIDNATGVTVLLLLAELLQDYHGKTIVEIVALNGEDYYGVPGQMKYIGENQNKFDDILMNINIDGAGYKEGKSALSFYGLPENIQQIANETVSRYDELVEGPQWPQSDHSIFIQFGRPAIAASSLWFTDNMETQDVTHTEKDNLDIVDPAKLVEIAQGLGYFIRRVSETVKE